MINSSSKTLQASPFVSVIVPVLNDAARLKTCLEALAVQTYPADQFEVLVVDNGSSDQPDQIVEQIGGARMVFEPRAGSFAARNTGIANTIGSILAFTDSDCIPHKDWIERAVAHLIEDEICGLLAGPVDVFFQNPAEPTPVELFQAASAFPQRQYVQNDQFGVTANLFTRRNVLEAVGYFDGTLQSGGDLEWGKRVYAAGYHVTYADDVAVRHPARNTIRQLCDKIKRDVPPAIDLLRRKPDDPTLRHFWGGRLKPPVGRMVQLVRQSGCAPLWRRLSAAGIAAYAHYFTTYVMYRHIWQSRQPTRR